MTAEFSRRVSSFSFLLVLVHPRSEALHSSSTSTHGIITQVCGLKGSFEALANPDTTQGCTETQFAGGEEYQGLLRV
jgi:hypothetical protein